MLNVVSCSLVTVFYGQVSNALLIHDELDRALEELDELKGIKRDPAQKRGTGRVGVARAASSDPAAGYFAIWVPVAGLSYGI